MAKYKHVYESIVTSLQVLGVDLELGMQAFPLGIEVGGTDLYLTYGVGVNSIHRMRIGSLGRSGRIDMAKEYANLDSEGGCNRLDLRGLPAGHVELICFVKRELENRANLLLAEKKAQEDRDLDAEGRAKVGSAPWTTLGIPHVVQRVAKNVGIS